MLVVWELSWWELGVVDAGGLRWAFGFSTAAQANGASPVWLFACKVRSWRALSPAVGSSSGWTVKGFE